ncbi:hypothetical protein L6303_06010 [archaeon]|nr:hypothetical protein [Nanoarchaeota archaeon]MCG2724272.1 hypothetical protein [archaeon]
MGTLLKVNVQEPINRFVQVEPYSESFQERFIQRRNFDVKHRILNFLKKSGNGKHTVTHGTFRKLISPTYYKTESRQVIKLLETEGFLRDSGVYIYILNSEVDEK